MNVITDILEWRINSPSPKARIPKNLREALALLELPGFDTVPEKLFAIANNLTLRPVCAVCSGRVSFTGKFGKTCSVKCAAVNPARKVKIEQTSLLNYGVSHASKTSEFKEKSRRTNLIRYGVQSSSQADAVKLKTAETNISRYGNKCTLNSVASVISKKETWIKLHGFDNPAKVQAIKDKSALTIIANNIIPKALRLNELKELHGITALFDSWVGSGELYSWEHKCGTKFTSHFVGSVIPRCPTCFPKIVSTEERQIQELLTRLGIHFISNDRTKISPKELDIFIPEANIAIEINGAYWHHDGRHPAGLRAKMELANAQGIQLLHFWDFEIREKIDIIENIIKAKLKLHKKIFARKLKCDQISAAEAAKFLNETHLAGFARAKMHFALRDEHSIKAVASFSANRFSSDGSWELVRFASSGSVVGGLSKLIAKFRKCICAPLVSFADARISDGGAYSKIGFKNCGLTKPNYFYIKGYRRLHRQQAMKHKLKNFLNNFDIGLTEYQNMKLNGWDRCSDCGSYKFILE